MPCSGAGECKPLPTVGAPNTTTLLALWLHHPARATTMMLHVISLANILAGQIVLR